MRRAAIAMALVLLVLSVHAISGCRRSGGPRDDGAVGQAGTSGQPGPAALPELLWSWPSEAEAKAAPGVNTVAFFRFAAPVTPGSVAFTVEPESSATLAYAGEMVMVYLDQLQHLSRVTLRDPSGAELATAYLLAASQAPHELPEVTASEGRDRVSADGYQGMGGPGTGPLADGARVLIGPGDVMVDLLVPAGVTEEALRAALAFEPEPDLAFVPNWSDSEGPAASSVLQVRWPGVPVTGHQFPDPLEVAGTSSAPADFALEMSLVVDSGKLPAFAGLAGSDGLYRLEFERTTAPDFTARSLDDEAIGLPYPGFRTIYHLPRGPHRFRLEFATPMDRASVERSLAGWGAYRDPPAWEFRWRDDQTLDVTVTPPAALFTLDIYPSRAQDQRGLLLWFSEELTVAWSPPQSLVRVPTSDPATPAEKVVEAPPGLVPLAMPKGASRLLAYEVSDPGHEGDGPDVYHPWVFEESSGRWSDWAERTQPWQRSVWLDDGRLFVDRRAGWQVYDAATGALSRQVSLSSSVDRYLGLTPDPAGQRVAVLRAPSPRAWGGLDQVDLAVLDLGGDPAAGPSGLPIKPLPAVTTLGDDDFYLSWLPTAWAGDETLILVDRPDNESTRLVQVDLATRQVTALPGTEGASRWEGGLFTVFGGSPPCCTFATRDKQGNLGDLVLYNIDARKVLYRFGLLALKVGPVPTRCLPSPDGHYLAFSGEGRSFIWDLSAQARAVGGGSPTTPVIPVGAEIEGMVVGWSADSQWIYLARASG